MLQYQTKCENRSGPPPENETTNCEQLVAHCNVNSNFDQDFSKHCRSVSIDLIWSLSSRPNKIQIQPLQLQNFQFYTFLALSVKLRRLLQAYPTTCLLAMWRSMLALPATALGQEALRMAKRRFRLPKLFYPSGPTRTSRQSKLN